MNTLYGSNYTKDSDGKIVVTTQPLLVSKKYGMLYRKDTCDLRMLNEGTSDYTTIDCKDKIVMDCGANIGGFVRAACISGAKEVHCYEPEPFNLNVLNENVGLLNKEYNTKISVNGAALVANDDDIVTFNINGSNNSACSGSLLKIAASIPLTVKAVNFFNELDRIRPQIIKMDIEGGEYDLIHQEFPQYVEEVAIELHGWRKETHKKMMSYIESIQTNPKYDIVSLKYIKVFGNDSLAIMHFKRRKTV